MNKSQPLPTMPFSDHLEELRSRIIRSLLYIVAATILCLFFQDPLMNFAIYPHKKVMEKILSKRKKNSPLQQLQSLLQHSQPHLSPSEQKLWQATLHYLNYLEKRREKNASKLKIMKYQSAFLAYLKVCIIAGIFFAAPLILWEIWAFVAAGLYAHEKKALTFFSPLVLLSFLLGSWFGYHFLIPIGLEYLATFANPEIAQNFISLDWYLSLFFGLTLAIGLVFELPLVMFLLNKMGVFTTKDYLRGWRYWILISTIIGAVLTPPDPITQMLLAVPMCLLYGLGVLLSYLFPYVPMDEVEIDEESWKQPLEEENNP
ncbi:MAG: twin-arginine translocase subunit TatC [Planctomycetota bacterium]|nr:MAG: twin-arginine translocase subunit TatC [Planctomycetota bacterium]